jgi:hypothetical protein
MAKYTIQKTTLDAIAAAIVDQTGDTGVITQTNMAAKIRSIDNDKVTCKTTMYGELSEYLSAAAKISYGVEVSVEKLLKAAYYEHTGGTSLEGSIEASAGDWILATVTTRSTTTYPEGWTVLRKSTVLNSDGSSQRMAFLCKQASAYGVENINIAQSSSGRIYINLLVFPDIQGFAYHDGTEVYSNTEASSIEVDRPNYDAVVWGCTANTWSSGNWTCGSLPTYCMAISAPRQANFVDKEPSVTKRTFKQPSSSRYIIDCVEVLL